MNEITVSPALARHIAASMKPIQDILERQASIAASFAPIYENVESFQAMAEEISKIYTPQLPVIRQNLLAASTAYASAIRSSGALEAVKQTQALAASLRMITIDFSGLQLPNLDMSAVLEGIGEHIQAGDIPYEFIDEANEAVEELGLFFPPPYGSFTDKTIDYALQISSAKFWVWMLILLFYVSIIQKDFDWEKTIQTVAGYFALRPAQLRIDKALEKGLSHRPDTT